ncbi:MAG: type II toxin-antitoxin system VapC family toxin [Acetobacteraceae bacterium]|jgi:predicted nucleic acid-binding protein
MVILDTNVLSELMRQRPERMVTIWLDRQAEPSVWTTSINVFEIRSGIEILPDSRRRSLLETEFERLIEEDIGRRVISFDTAAAEQAATLLTVRQRAGRPGELRDTMIAGIVLANHATLATRNTRHFADLPVPMVNPWSE